jgi:hypothetical protein
LGFPTGCYYTPSSSFLAPLPGNKEEQSPSSTRRRQQVFWRRCRGGKRLLQGESRKHNLLLCFSFALLYFFLHHFIRNTKKLVSFIVAFTYLLFSLVRMSNPKVEVRTFKQ